MTVAVPTCLFLAECKHVQDTGTHKKLKPTEEIITTMKEHPNAPRKKLTSETHKRMEGNDKEHIWAMPSKRNELRSDSATALTEHHFAFTMAASVDTLPMS